MTFRKQILAAFLGLASSSLLHAQASVGEDLPDLIGFTQAPASAPLQNLSEFDYRDIDGEVAVVVYHAAW